MTSRKVEVEVTCDNTAKPFLYIPHPTLSATRLAIVGAGKASSNGRPSDPFNRLKAEENARKRGWLSLQESYLSKSPTTRSHLLPLLTAHSSSHSHDDYTSSHTGTKASLC
jgi:hypothetical protein